MAVRFRSPAQIIKTSLFLDWFFVVYGQLNRTEEGVGKENSFPCRNGFKTEGFEGALERSRKGDRFAFRSPAPNKNRLMGGFLLGRAESNRKKIFSLKF